VAAKFKNFILKKIPKKQKHYDFLVKCWLNLLIFSADLALSRLF